MEDDDGDGYPPRGGHILESSPIRATGSSSSSRYPLQSTPEWDQAHLEQERQQRIRFRQQLAGNSSQSSQHRQAQQQQVSSSAQQQAKAHQISTSCAQPTASASTVKLLLLWLDQMQPRLIPLLLLLQSRREVV
jgi:hypothetical protein